MSDAPAGNAFDFPAADRAPAARRPVAAVYGSDPLAADLADHLRRGGRVDVAPPADPPSILLLFVPPRPTDAGRQALARTLSAARDRPLTFVGVISTFRVHLDDARAEAAEREVVAAVAKHVGNARVAVFRPGHVRGEASPAGRWIRRLAPLYPLAAGRLCSCVVDADRLFAAVEAEATRADRDEAESGADGRPLGRRFRVYTLLGPNVAWRDLLRRHAGDSFGSRLATGLATALSWLLVGQLIGLAVSILTRWSPTARSLAVGTLRPRSFPELLALCHAGNVDHVRVVGYNNGVHHFGHRHPGRTVVSTVNCRRTAPAGPGRMKADSGATVKAARDFLDARGEEPYVVPNYSYVALGTSLFVPIHGSAVHYSTVADTVTRVVYYDPDTDRVVRADRDDPAFRRVVYNHRSRAVVLRLYLLTRPKARYFVRRETWIHADAARLSAALRDESASNVEIRQGHAASPRVTVSTYFGNADGAPGPVLETPRDALGRLWDRLEENPVSSFLMHALSRHVAWHTELFLTPAEFATFWATHARVPLRKIQLRAIRRDGLPHSPFRDGDCVSADLFLFRWDKPAFDAYVASMLPNVRTNPGKHSR